MLRVKIMVPSAYHRGVLSAQPDPPGGDELLHHIAQLGPAAEEAEVLTSTGPAAVTHRAFHRRAGTRRAAVISTAIGSGRRSPAVTFHGRRLMIARGPIRSTRPSSSPFVCRFRRTRVSVRLIHFTIA